MKGKVLYAIRIVSLLILLETILLICPVAWASEDESSETAQKPGITLLGEQTVTMSCGRPYEEPGYYAADGEGRDVTDRVRVEGEVCVWKTGSYDLLYLFEDELGNRYEASREIEVVPVSLPDTIVRERTIYLTFDDGPCAYTQDVLNTLEKYQAKATFFVNVNDSNRYLDLLPEIVERGHTLGVHCNDHDYGRLYSSETSYFEDLMEAQSKVYQATGRYAELCRFPGGSTTAWAMLGRRTEGGFAQIEERIREMGMRYYDWNVNSEADGSGAGDVYYRFRAQVPRVESPVCLFHDTRLYSVKALELLLIWGQENGYSFLAMDLTTPEVHESKK